MMVWLKACPMCSVPVTLGGGNCMLKDGLAGSTEAAKYPRFSHSERQKASMSAGSKDLANSMILKELNRIEHYICERACDQRCAGPELDSDPNGGKMQDFAGWSGAIRNCPVLLAGYVSVGR